MSAIDTRLAEALRRTLDQGLAWPDGWAEVAERYVSHEEEDLAARVTDEEAEAGEGNRLTLSALDLAEVSRIVFGLRLESAEPEEAEAARQGGRDRRSRVFLLLEGEKGLEADELEIVPWEGEMVPAGIGESPMALAELLRRTRPAMAGPRW